jgi:hypothetical protein
MHKYTLAESLHKRKTPVNFKKATDELLGAVTLEDLASALGASLQAVRQARAQEGAAGFRRPPAGWEAAGAKLARKQAAKLERLAERLERAP